MIDVTIETRNEEETAELGKALAALLPLGTTVALDGTLGAGKTRLVQAIAAALGVESGTVLSPTFVLVQEYHGLRDIYHIDAYRIADDDEFLALGADEMLSSDALVLIEWADRIQRCLPRERLGIAIADLGDTSRRFEISAIGERLRPVINGLKVWQAERS